MRCFLSRQFCDSAGQCRTSACLYHSEIPCTWRSPRHEFIPCVIRNILGHHLNTTVRHAGVPSALTVASCKNLACFADALFFRAVSKSPRQVMVLVTSDLSQTAHATSQTGKRTGRCDSLEPCTQPVDCEESPKTTIVKQHVQQQEEVHFGTRAVKLLLAPPWPRQPQSHKPSARLHAKPTPVPGRSCR